jgi:hypothetical protein
MCSSSALGRCCRQYSTRTSGLPWLSVDCTTFPHDKAYAEYLSPTCTPLLAQFSVLDATLTAAPQRLQGMRVIDHRSRSCWRHFIQDGQCLYGLALSRLGLDYLLVAQACREGVELHTGCWVRQPLLDCQRVCGGTSYIVQQCPLFRQSAELLSRTSSGIA